jgi:hypothetical protein
MDFEVLKVADTIKREIDFYLKKQQPEDKQMLSVLYTDMGKLSYENYDSIFIARDRGQDGTSYNEKDIKTLLTSIEMSNHVLRSMRDKYIDDLSMTLKEVSNTLEQNMSTYCFRIFSDYAQKTGHSFSENELLTIKSRWTYEKGREFFADPNKQVKEWEKTISQSKSLSR